MLMTSSDNSNLSVQAPILAHLLTLNRQIWLGLGLGTLIYIIQWPEMTLLHRIAGASSPE
jgi:hypothetical protein